MRATTLTAIFVAAAAAAFALLAAPKDSDLFWQLASGQWTLDHGRLLDQDVWSFTSAGTPYSVGAWLGQVALAVAFRVGTWLGIDVLRAALVATAALFVARTTLRVQPHAGWAIVPILGTILVSSTVWGDRPQLFTVALFPLVLDLLFMARLDGRPRWLFALPVVFLLWANLHGAFAIGLVAIAIFALDALLERDERTRAPLAAALVASVVATQFNPSAVGAIGRAVAYGALLPGWVVEDRALDVLSGAGVVFAALLLAAIAAAMACGPEGVAARLGAPLLWPFLIAPFAVLGLAVQREAPYACMVLAPFVAAMVPEALRRPRAVAPLLRRSVGVGIATALVIALAAEAALAAPRQPDLTAYPADALVALDGIDGHVLNEYDWGGFLIWYAPTHRTFIDGRGVALFPPEILNDFESAVSLAPNYRDVLARWDIRAVLIRPDRPLAGALKEDGWRKAASGDRWILLSRP